MVEVEMKFPIRDWTYLVRKLAAWGGQERETVQEQDHYFNAPDRDFARTDEALRLRRVGSSNYLTYKGPKKDPETKTRLEVEVPLAPGHEPAQALTQLLEHLGYRPVALVEKERQVLQVDKGGYSLSVCLDDVKKVGRFVELEILAPDDQVDSARRVLLAAANELGLDTSERRSYLELLLAKQQTS
jgi:adenylate cyclase class 2